MPCRPGTFSSLPTSPFVDNFLIADRPDVGLSVTDQVKHPQDVQAVLFSSTLNHRRAEFVLLARCATRWFG